MEENVKINMHEGFLVSEDNIIIEVNKNFLEIIEYTEDELIGKTLVEASKMLRLDSQISLQDVEKDTKVFLFTKLSFAIEGILSCKTINNGMQRLFSFKRDLSNNIDEKFNLANQLGIIKGDGVAIFSFPNLILLNSNQNYLNLLEPPYNKRKDSIGKSSTEIFSEYSSKLFDKMKSYICNTGSPFYSEEVEINTSFLGKTYWDITSVPILQNQEIKYLILSVSNVTEKVIGRKAIKQRNEELENIMHKEENRLIKTQNELLDMQNQMFTTISHELKTPLSVIFSASQLIELYMKEEIQKINKDDINKSMEIIKQNCYRFTKLINNIIDLSRIESGFYKLNFRNGNIVEIVEDIIDSVRSYVENKGLQIIFNTDIEEKTIAVDIDKLERIILNLVSNAAKSSLESGTIFVEIKDKGDFVDILVRDYGIGIDKKHLDTIFDKYTKVDNSLARNAEGSGIGLALVKAMVDLIGGDISVKSEPEKGSLFILKLPVKLSHESDVINTIEHSVNRIEKINIEFSDVYSK